MGDNEEVKICGASLVTRQGDAFLGVAECHLLQPGRQGI